MTLTKRLAILGLNVSKLSGYPVAQRLMQSFLNGNLALLYEFDHEFLFEFSLVKKFQGHISIFHPFDCNLCFLFYSSFPNDLSKIACDVVELCTRIDIAIRNVNGVRNHSYTPHMAFESIVKKEISRLKEPISTCVGSVIQLLSVAVRICTQRVSNYQNDN